MATYLVLLIVKPVYYGLNVVFAIAVGLQHGILSYVQSDELLIDIFNCRINEAKVALQP